MHINSKRTSIARRPAALSVLVGLSLLGGVPLIASQVAPTQAEALAGVGAIEGKETTIRLSDMPADCFSGRKTVNGDTKETEYLMTGKADNPFVTYRFDVEKSGTYDLSIESRSTEENTKRNYVFVDGKQEYDLMYTKGASYQWVTYSVFLETGSHEVTIKPDWGWTFFRDLKVKCTGLRKTSADTLAECDATTSNGINSYRHTDDSTLLINPGKGLSALGDANTTDTGYLSMLSLDYTRWCWADIEPKEGEYDWSFMDAYIERAAFRGHKAAFGIMSFCTTNFVQNATPRWVFDEAGADGRWIHYGGDETTPAMFCPNWDDPIYQEKVANFAKALAAKYDGDPRIAFIDMRAWGNWGEQHIFSLDESVGGYPWISSDTLINKYMKPYRDAFKKTLIVNCCNADKYPEAYKWAVDHGMGLRRDGILVSSNGGEFRRFNSGENTPNIYEYHMTYPDTMAYHGWTSNKQYTDELEFEIRNGAASYLQMNEDMYREMENEYRYFGNLIGYWWRMPESSITSSVDSGQAVKASYQIRNDGVAHSYDRTAKVKARICDAEGNVVKAIDDTGAKPWKWEPGKMNDDKTWTDPVVSNESFDIDTAGLAPGRYYVSIGVFGENASGPNPDTLIGSLGRDVYGWESIGMFEVNQPAAPTPDTPGDSGTHGGTPGGEQGGTADGNGSGTGTEAKPDRKPDSATDGKGDAGADSESDGKWHMPTNPRKRRALVQTGYTAGGLTAGIVAAGVAAMIARAARRRHR